MITIPPLTERQQEVQDRVEQRTQLMGGKAANLEELQQMVVAHAKTVEARIGIKIRCQIPDFQPLYDEFIAAHLDKFAPRWREHWATFIKSFEEQQKQTTGEITSFTQEGVKALEQIQTLIIKTLDEHPIPEEVLSKFLSELHKDANLMVRSTTLSEDSATAALPGAFTTESAVPQDSKAISHAIGVVGASYFTPESFMQRLANHVNISQKPFMAVLIQRQIGEKLGGDEDPDQVIRSGVMYTSKMGTKIQLAPGHGQLVVNNEGTTDGFFVTQENVVHAEINRKSYRLVPVEVLEGGKKKRKLIFRKNESSLKNNPAISNEVVLAIAEWGHIIEEHYGRPMDVEFVYYPKERMLNLVQARPIPEGDLKLVIPSSISPSKLPLVKKQAGKERVIKSPVITPAGDAAHVITRPEEILICEDIVTAKNLYFGPPKKTSVKAVIVGEMSAETSVSHEAAQLNSNAIPVLKVDNLEQVEEWISKEKPVLIVDPQHQQLIDWTDQIADHSKAEEELYAKGVLEKGLFKSSLPARETLLPVFE